MLDAAVINLSENPDRVLIYEPRLNATRARNAARFAANHARSRMPRSSGQSSRNLQPLYGKGYFGILVPDAYVWFQERGTNPHVMTSLAGKTIPMWITDDDGQARRDNPKAETRQTDDGRTQVLIFRKATRPGAPSRTPDGRLPRGRRSSVAWRNPGVTGKHFLSNALEAAALEHGIQASRYFVADRSWRHSVDSNLED